MIRIGGKECRHQRQWCIWGDLFDPYRRSTSECPAMKCFEELIFFDKHNPLNKQSMTNVLEDEDAVTKLETSYRSPAAMLILLEKKFISRFDDEAWWEYKTDASRFDGTTKCENDLATPRKAKLSKFCMVQYWPERIRMNEVCWHDFIVCAMQILSFDRTLCSEWDFSFKTSYRRRQGIHSLVAWNIEATIQSKTLARLCHSTKINETLESKNRTCESFLEQRQC